VKGRKLTRRILRRGEGGRKISRKKKRSQGKEEKK
jgi:hypothetical protein